MKSFVAKSEPTDKKWYLIDAKGVVLGDLCVKIANIIRGKNKPTFTPNVDCGDFVVVINAKDIVLTGKKLDQKKYFTHSGYIGGIKEITARKLLAKDPERMIKHGVWGMLPKNRLSKRLINKLKVYIDENHPHKAQKPQEIKVGE
ncbi:MAG: 50S ribosomal protein L13 [Desulfurella sp.]|jgi:large subunit ribosomal protein L13|uniref:50S ribosomal protein L13 n=1 Tax=Desulfurella TaxID=33001 RepID=UPI0003E0ADA2|nr:MULTISPECIES: 50S ribosomal protein L13 [Desulfurella]AHF96656.1 50S ribosomal protein L13 [Desulfurella acetivorans A63]PMP68971.1 MAG: 50S ribosomal protein L13 [Desulfurella multipotens]PMP89892.1 MAG: 50S ribosomal protein L13 [Desulfurella sp.]HEX14103.1 50S ribosomal protein L13 [Desulfurella acetivorans]